MLEEAAAQFEATLTRIESGTATGADLQRLREALSSRAIHYIAQLGKYNINIGQGEGVHIGDRTYVEINEEAIQKIVAAIQQSSPSLRPSTPAQVDFQPYLRSLTTEERLSWTFGEKAGGC